MNFIIEKSKLSGTVIIPGSKSHTIRALVLALLAKEISVIENPLVSADTLACLEMIKEFGAEVEENGNSWKIKGCGQNLKTPQNPIDVKNSGTTLYFGLSLAGLIKDDVVFTGDSQIQKRPVTGILTALNNLGCEAYSLHRNGCPPVKVKGLLQGGETDVDGVTSQYLSSLLLVSPLLPKSTILHLPFLNEKPYVQMTLNWLSEAGVNVRHDNFENFYIDKNQCYKSLNSSIAADFSSATFFLVAAALSKQPLLIKGLNLNDVQGDKAVLGILTEMGAKIEQNAAGLLVSGGSLQGGEFDLNAMPDALPALAAMSVFAKGTTKFYNVAQARVKETDRLAVMCQELKKTGAQVKELADGLIISGSSESLQGADFDGHGDHRIVMALTILAAFLEGKSKISTAEAVAITVPQFYDLIKEIGLKIEKRG